MFSKATSEFSSRVLEELGHNKVAPRIMTTFVSPNLLFKFCIHIFLQFCKRLEQTHRNPLVRDFFNVSFHEKLVKTMEVVCFEQVVRRPVGLNDRQHLQLHPKTTSVSLVDGMRIVSL